MSVSSSEFPNKDKTVCFSGHRPEKLPDGGRMLSAKNNALKSILYTEVLNCIQQGYTEFLTGVSRGVDLWASEIVLELKNTYKHIRLVAVYPCRDFGEHFISRDKFILGNCCQYADEVVYLSEKYTKGCLRKRNEYMVNRSAKLIAVVSDYKSGTGQTIRYAEKQGIITRVIDAGKFSAGVDMLTDDDEVSDFRIHYIT